MAEGMARFFGSGGGGSQKPIFETGSFTGYHSTPVESLGTGYLSAAQTAKQAFCGNEEGWGPLSPIRYDFTPCFIDVWVASVAAFGIILGSIAVWWLIKKKTPGPVSKDWHFWTKQVGFNCPRERKKIIIRRDNALTLRRVLRSSLVSS